MKKQYIKPTVNTLLIEIQPMLAGSDLEKGGNDNTYWGSRQGRNTWDDEEEY